MKDEIRVKIDEIINLFKDAKTNLLMLRMNFDDLLRPIELDFSKNFQLLDLALDRVKTEFIDETKSDKMLQLAGKSLMITYQKKMSDDIISPLLKIYEKVKDPSKIPAVQLVQKDADKFTPIIHDIIEKMHELENEFS